MNEELTAYRAAALTALIPFMSEDIPVGQQRSLTVPIEAIATQADMLARATYRVAHEGDPLPDTPQQENS